MHLITYEKGWNYIDGFKYRLCLENCLSDPYFINISLTNFAVKINLLEGKLYTGQGMYYIQEVHYIFYRET
jgi:hypothetical protein